MKTTSASGGAPVRLPPPFLLLATGIFGLALQRLIPLALPLPPAAARATGIGLLVLAVLLIAAAFSLFQRTGQDPAPWKPTPQILTGGIYRFTRNPMYLSMAFILLGIGILRASGWLAAMAPVFLILVYLTAVRHEESYLEATFGDAYRQYRAQVRRWL